MHGSGIFDACTTHSSNSGVLIGYERKNRMKEAGIRTHFVVAVGVLPMMMIVSKYGFQDQAGWDNLSLDPSRGQLHKLLVVWGSLEQGMIFTQRHTVRGLTTAAGIWATAGMGLAVGSGLYWTGARRDTAYSRGTDVTA